MTDHRQTAIAGQITSPLARTSGLFEELRSVFRRSTARRQLLLLDERLLRDIGVDRGDIATGRF
jgi:uncharacterized protein YjiS (DUF1127 family)